MYQWDPSWLRGSRLLLGRLVHVWTKVGRPGGDFAAVLDAGLALDRSVGQHTSHVLEVFLMGRYSSPQ